MAERGRVAKMMVSDQVATERERKQSIEDLCTLITRDHAALHLPGEKPIDGICAGTGCSVIIAR